MKKNENNFTLFVGGTDESLAYKALEKDPSSYLIDLSNWNQQHNGTAYTSLGDLPGVDEFTFILRQAKTIIYVESPGDDVTKMYMNIFNMSKTTNVVNCPPMTVNSNFLSLSNKRTDQKKTLWVVGDSVAYGIGVEEKERYGNLIAEKLSLPVINMSWPGSSIDWAADQILRSDIRENDIVVWGLTSTLRFTGFNEHGLMHIYTGYYRRHPEFVNFVTPDFLDSSTTLYWALRSIYQVNNFCNKIGAKLVILGILSDIEIAKEIDLNNYLHVNGMFGDNFKDTGWDPRGHPGPESHKFYANTVLDYINENISI